MAGIMKNNEKKRAHFTFQWKIESSHPKYSCWYGPEFIVQSMEMTKWKLGMYTTKRREAKFLIIRTHEDEGPESIEIEYEISILDSNGSSLMKESSRGHFQKNKILYTTLYTHENLRERTELAVQCRFWRIKSAISKYELCFASTAFELYKRSCVWAVKGFSSLQQGEKRVRILKSTEEGCPQLTLTLSLAEKNKEECVFIHMEATADKIFEVEAKIALLDSEGMVFLVKWYLEIIYPNIKRNISSIFEKNKLMSNKTALSDDVLLLRCDFKLTSSKPVNNRIEDYKLMDYSDSNLVQGEESEMNFEELNETAVCPFKEMVKSFKADGSLCDISLRVGNKSFPAHKLILSSRSPVFKAMFTQDMKEKTSKCIDIPDLDADTLGRLLLYMYENKVTELTWEIATNLYEAADKYELLDLKEKCSLFLKSNFLKSNVCKILVIADLHQDESLRKSAQDFIRNNPEIVSSDVWKVFRNNHSELAWETAEQVICNMKPSQS